MKQRTPAELQRICENFNRVFPVGSEVRYHPVIGRHDFRLRNTKSEAYVLSGHTAVVFLEGESGCVAVEACQ